MQLMEQDQRPGRFSFDLIDGTPRRVITLLRDAVSNGSGYIFVEPLDSPEPPAGFTTADYIGFLTQSTGLLSFGGSGLTSRELGTDEGYGFNTPAVPGAPGGIPGTLAQWVEAIIVGGGSGFETSLTVGTVSGPAGTFDIPLLERNVEHRRAILDKVCAFFGVVWRLRDGITIDVGPRSTIYPAPSKVLTDRPGTQRTTVGLSAVSAYALSPTVDATHRIGIQRVYGAGDGFVASGSGIDSAGYSVMLDPTVDDINTQLRRDTLIQVTADDGTTQDYADGLVARSVNASRSFSVATTRGGRIRRALPVGSRMFVWFPRAGIEDRTNPQPLNGSHCFPVESVLIGATTQIAEGHGVWLFRPQETPQWERLTPYVQFGDGSSMMDVSTDLDYRYSAGSDRFGKQTVLEALRA